MSSNRKFTKRSLNGGRYRSLPLIIPDNTKYDAATNELKRISDRRRTGLKLVPETLKLLESIEKPLAVLAIGGPCRTGKSYVLSRVLGSADDFALGHTMDAKTFGIWMGTTVLECDEFTVLLIDTEGIDSPIAAVRDDVSILVMTMLLSSYFIYNSIGVPKKNDLERMGCLAKLATSIAVRDTSAPEIFELKNYFPDFLWLLRDAILQVPSGPDGRKMTPTEYLKKKILKRENSFEESKSDKIGRAILVVFPTIECMTISSPSADPWVMQNIAAKQDCLEPRFNEEIDHLIKYLHQHVRAKNGFVEGKLVNGPLLAAMTNDFLKAVNDPDTIPCIADTWQIAVEVRCKKALDELVEEYTHDMEAKIAEIGLPMEEDSVDDKGPANSCTLLGLHRLTLLQKTENLLQQVGHFVGGDGSSTYSRESVVAELQKCTAEITISNQGRIQKKRIVGGILYRFAERNRSESRAHCIVLLQKLVEEKMRTKHNSNFGEDLQKEFYARAIGPAKCEVYTDNESFIKIAFGVPKAVPIYVPPLSPKTLILLKWKDKHGCKQSFRLEDRVSSRWMDFGMILGLTMSQLEGWKMEYQGNATACWRKVMDFWLTGEVKSCDYSVTWEGLYELLNDTKYSVVARELEEAVANCMQAN